MRFPAINDHPLRKVSVPQLSGGVNKTDHPSYINDNQLTECNNMWFKDGKLRTRPGIEVKGAVSVSACLQLLSKGNNLHFLHTDGVTSIAIGEGVEGTGKFKEFYQGVYRFPEGADVSLTRGFLAPISKQQQGSGNEVGGTLVIGESDEWGLFMAEHFMLSDTLGENIPPYIPTLKTNVEPNRSPGVTSNGYMFQGINLLDSSYKIACNAEGDGWAWTLPTISGEIYYIDIEYYDSKKGKQTGRINVKLCLDGEQGFTNTTGEMNVTVKNTQNGNLEPTKGYFEYYPGTNAVVVNTTDPLQPDSAAGPNLGIYSSKKNGLIITVVFYPYKNSKPIDDNYSKITSMTTARWFGGARGGLENGTRLFVAGGKEEGIIRWSDLNRPNYFSENNYAYVGDGSKITALAQQDDMLVIFQEHAITYATYIEGVEYTAKDVMEDKVVDVTTLAARFPLTNIHSEIGCDCKDTVRLCNNRLVWLTSEGKVYCLVNNNQYNERNVREISYAIEKLLKQHSKEELKEAKSATADGKYFLFVANKVYVLDYGNTSFEYYTYHSHEKSLKNYLSWYMWTLPEFINKVTGVEGFGDRLCIIADTKMAACEIFEINLNTLKECKTEDYASSGEVTNYAIPCSFRTKLFAFSGAERMKRIPNCNISVCKIPGEIEVSFVTDNGSGNPRYISIDEEVSEDNPDAVKRMTLYPNANGTCLFGIEMKSESVMAVEGISISYKEMRDRQ